MFIVFYIKIAILPGANLYQLDIDYWLLSLKFEYVTCFLFKVAFVAVPASYIHNNRSTDTEIKKMSFKHNRMSNRNWK